MPELTQAAFGKSQGWSKSYVTQLKQAGRLVMVKDGKRERVDVDASLARIDETKDPNRDDVKARHETNRGNGGPPPTAEYEQIGKSYSAARAVKERYAALSAKLAYEVEAGSKVDADEVRRAGMDIGTAVRMALENLSDRLAPELAPESDPARVHALLVENFEHVLGNLSRNLESVCKASALENE